MNEYYLNLVGFHESLLGSIDKEKSSIQGILKNILVLFFIFLFLGLLLMLFLNLKILYSQREVLVKFLDIPITSVIQ
jgi:hypothetical protein